MYQWVFSTQNEERRKLVFKTKGKKFREKNCIKAEKRTYLCLFIDPCIKMLAIILHLFKTILNIRFYLNPRRSTVILELSCLRQIFDSSRWIFDKPVGSDELVSDCRIPYSLSPFCWIPYCRLLLKMTKFHNIIFYLKKNIDDVYIFDWKQ